MAFTDAFNRWLEEWKVRESKRTGKPLALIYDKDIALKMGVSQSLISRWRNGRNPPNKQNCEIVARFFGLPLSQVLAAAGLATISSPTTVTELLAAAAAESLNWGADAGELLLAVRYLADPVFLRSGYGVPARRILGNDQLSIYVKTTLLADLVRRWQEEVHEGGDMSPPSPLPSLARATP